MKFLFTLLLALLFVPAWAQNGTRLIDYHAKTMGRAGTAIGVFDSPTLHLSNPGGLSFLKNPMVDANFSLMAPTLHFINNINDVDGEDNLFPLPSLSAAWPCMFNEKITIGAGFFTTGGMGADFKLNHALYRDPNGNYIPQDYHSMLATMQGGLSASYLITEEMAIGVSAHVVYSMLEFQMPYSLNPSIMAGIAQPGMTFGQMFAAPPASGGFGYEEVTASAKMDELSSFGFNGKIGFAWKPSDELSVGLSYTLPTTLTYSEGAASMDMTQQFNDAFGKAVMGYMAQNPGSTPAQAQQAVAGQFSQMGIDLNAGMQATYDLEVELKFPQSFGAGVAYRVLPELNLSADFEWINWSSAFDNMKLTLTNGSNANINKMIGADNLKLEFPLKWEDTFVIKLGAEYDVTDMLTARAGYVYGSNPVPESTVFPVFPAVVDQHFTVGASYRVMPSLTLHGAFEMAPEKSLTASSDSEIANEYNNSTSRLGTMLFHFAATYNF